MVTNMITNMVTNIVYKISVGHQHANLIKVGCVFTMVIWSEFHMGQFRDDEHQENAHHFTLGWREPAWNLREGVVNFYETWLLNQIYYEVINKTGRNHEPDEKSLS